ncbi:unnamed protein product [Cuscuta campestris]|uniref:Uncharacterized protein n=1 Tax=Cuscuta campestris TaxID=132261 RepID=A0A484KKC0_9ASTE|nr:unnamed protein product [Cuscuta campestris]
MGSDGNEVEGKIGGIRRRWKCRDDDEQILLNSEISLHPIGTPLVLAVGVMRRTQSTGNGHAIFTSASIFCGESDKPIYLLAGSHERVVPFLSSFLLPGFRGDCVRNGFEAHYCVRGVASIF